MVLCIINVCRSHSHNSQQSATPATTHSYYQQHYYPNYQPFYNSAAAAAWWAAYQQPPASYYYGQYPDSGYAYATQPYHNSSAYSVPHQFYAVLQYDAVRCANSYPSGPSFFLIVAKTSLPKHSTPYWSNPPFLMALSLECQSAQMSKNYKGWVRPVWP